MYSTICYSFSNSHIVDEVLSDEFEASCVVTNAAQPKKEGLSWRTV